jgi:hypothetical protein
MWAAIKEHLFGKWELMGYGTHMLSITRGADPRPEDYHVMICFWQNSKTQKRKYTKTMHIHLWRVWKSTEFYVGCELWVASGIQPDFYQDAVAAKLKHIA